MKYIITIYLLFIVGKAWGQDCESYTPLFNFTTSSIVKAEGKVSVTFNVTTGSLPKGCKQVYVWEFGDGTSNSQTIYPTGNYTIQTHAYNLNNSGIVQYGALQANVRLTVYVYGTDDDFTYSSDCNSYTCYSWDETLTYTLPSSNYIISLSASPVANDYPLDSPISFSFLINPSSITQTDNLTYNLLKDGYIVKNGGISASELNTTVNFYTFTPTKAGIYSYEFQLKRYNEVVGYSFPLSISIASGGTVTPGPPPYIPGSCIYKDIKPSLDVQYWIKKGKIWFYAYDCSSKEFTSTYIHCAHYNIDVAGPGGSARIVDNYYYQGNDYGGSFQAAAPSILDGPQKYRFTISVEYAKGKFLSNYKEVIVEPIQFNPKDNYDTILIAGDNVFINTYTKACKSVDMFNPVDPNDNLDWVQKFKIDDNLTFTVPRNYSTKDRYLTIKLFVNGDYSEYEDVVNGKRTGYRTIKIFQPTDLKFVKVDKTSTDVISYPGDYEPANTDHVVIDENHNIFESEEYLSLSDIGYGIYLNYYDKFNVKLGEQFYHFQKFVCSKSWSFEGDIIPFLKTSYPYIVSARKKEPFTISKYTFPTHHSLAIFSNEEINIGTDFEVPEGANFNAGIKSCDDSNLKSMDTSEVYASYENIENAPYKLPDSVTSSLDVLVYPNPSFGSLIIENKTPEQPITSIHIINGQGSCIKQITPKNNIEVANLRGNTPGVYIVKISTKTEIIYKKIILQAEQ